MKTFSLILIMLWGGASFAQPQQSENFRITKSVLDAGGGVSTSVNFLLTSAFGQPTPIGNSSSANFVLSAGFLSPEFAASPLSPITDLVIQRQSGLSSNMKLDWSAVSGATLYTIYRNINPVFTPGPADSVGTSTTNGYVDANALNLPLNKYFYIVTSTSSGEPVLRAADAVSVRHSAKDAARAAPGGKRDRHESQ